MALTSVLVALLLTADGGAAAPMTAPSTSAMPLIAELVDTVGPRLSGSEGDRRAVDWAVRQMKALGLQDVRAEPVKVPRWVRGEEAGEVTAPVRQSLVLTALGGSAATPRKGVEAELVQVRSMDELAALPPERVRGRIVFYNQKMERSPTGQGYGAVGPGRLRGPAHAAKKGAVAFVIRSLSTSGRRFAHTGTTLFREGEKAIPAAAISTPDAELIERLAEGGKPVKLRMLLSCRTLPDAMSANIIGEVRGTEKPDELVVIGAHLDSWDLGPGAQDNAVGVGVVMEAGRRLLANPPRRTVRVVLFANEENGGKGGDAYAQVHAAEVPKHQAAFVLDAGGGRAGALSYFAGPGAEAVFEQVKKQVEPLGITDVRARSFAHPDVTPLKLLGVPLYGLGQDASHYFDVHHTADDTLVHVDPENVEQLVRATTEVTRAIADLPELLPRIPEEQRPRAPSKW